MRLSYKTALLIVATVAMAQAADPANRDQVNSALAVKRADVADVTAKMELLQTLMRNKRLVSPADMEAFDKRAETEVGNLVVAILNSGYINTVIQTILNDPDLKGVIGTVALGILNTVLNNAWDLISAIWNSGLVGKTINLFLTDNEVSSAFFKIVGTIVSSLFNTVVGWFSGSTDSGSSTTAAGSTVVAVTPTTVETTVPELTTTAVAVSTQANSQGDQGDVNDIPLPSGTVDDGSNASPTNNDDIVASLQAAYGGKRDLSQNDAIIASLAAEYGVKRGLGQEDAIIASLAAEYGPKRTVRSVQNEYLTEREVQDVSSALVSQLKNSDLVESFLSKLTANSGQASDFLSQVLKQGAVSLDEVYGWAKDAGIVDSMLTTLENSGNEYATTFANWLEKNGGDFQNAVKNFGNKEEPAPAAHKKRMMY